MNTFAKKILLAALSMFMIAPLFTFATFSDYNNSDDATASKTSFFSIDINPDDIFMKIRRFLVITPHKGTTTGFAINIGVNKDEVGKTESWIQSAKDYSIQYIEIVNRNVQQKTGVDAIAIFMFFYNNLYNMFATTFGLIKSVLPQ